MLKGLTLDTPSRPGETPSVDHPERRGDRPWLIWVLMAMAVLVVVGLAFAVFRPGANEEDQRAGSGPPPAPTEQEKQAVADTVLASLRVALEANSPPDPARLEEVRNYTTDRAFESVANAVRDNQQKGLMTRPGPSGRSQKQVEVVSISDDTAIARLCSVDDGLVVEQATGRVVNDEVVTRLYIVFLVREDGRWKVQNNRVEQKWAGVAGCAGAP